MGARSTAKTKYVGLKLTQDQHRVIAQRAEKCGVRMSTWMRSILVQAAMRSASDGHLRIKEPDGALT